MLLDHSGELLLDKSIVEFQNFICLFQPTNFFQKMQNKHVYAILQLDAKVLFKRTFIFSYSY